jgi:transposase
MSKTYLPAIEENFPNAENIIDKFHVKKVLIDALDEVRKAEQKMVTDKKELFRGRRLFMIPEAKLNAEQAATISEMSKRYPQTGRAYRIVAGLDDFYSSQTVDEAENSFQGLYSWMRRCRLKPMKEAAETLMRHKTKILAYFKNRITNAICEGINSMIQAAKRKARGFHTFVGYSSMIYLVAGKLELAVPNPF